MPDKRWATCRVCGRHRDEVGLLSWTGKCGYCGPYLMEENARSIAAKDGPPYLRQQARQYLSARRVLMDAGLLKS